MVTPVLIGLWAWLFTETLTKRGHIFYTLAIEAKEDSPVAVRLWEKYTTCPVCHAGALAVAFGLLKAVMLTVILLNKGWSIDFFEVASDEIATVFIAYPIIAMSVAKVMSLKF